MRDGRRGGSNNADDELAKSAPGSERRRGRSCAIVHMIHDISLGRIRWERKRERSQLPPLPPKPPAATRSGSEFDVRAVAIILLHTEKPKALNKASPISQHCDPHYEGSAVLQFI